MKGKFFEKKNIWFLILKIKNNTTIRLRELKFDMNFVYVCTSTSMFVYCFKLCMQ